MSGGGGQTAGSSKRRQENAGGSQRSLQSNVDTPEPLTASACILTGWKAELGAATEPVSCRYSSHRKFSGFG